MNSEVGLGFHPQPHSFPVLNKPYGFCGRKAPFFFFYFFFFVLGSHFPMNRKLLGELAALLRGMQSPMQWYNEKKQKEKGKKGRKKDRNKNKKLTGEWALCINYFRGIRLDQSDYHSGPRGRTPTGTAPAFTYPLFVNT